MMSNKKKTGNDTGNRDRKCLDLFAHVMTECTRVYMS